ncbi:hypothetical protein BASA81_008317 [Batrachochytrium salamandrivorans]|nr:hypothetical protein BASA81_008317 [Batrachochytrium salamandrivorans]
MWLARRLVSTKAGRLEVRELITKGLPGVEAILSDPTRVENLDFETCSRALGCCLAAQPAVPARLLEIASAFPSRPSQLVFMCAALAKSRLPVPEFVHARLEVTKFNPGGVVSLLCSFSELNQTARVDFVLRDLQDKTNQLSHQQLATALWALARLNVKRDALVDGLIARLEVGLNDLPTPSLARLLRTCAHWNAPELGSKVCKELIASTNRNLDECSAEEVTIALEAIGRLNLTQPQPAVDMLVDQVNLRNLVFNQSLPPSELVTLLYACRKLHQTGRLNLSGELTQQRLSPRDLSAVLWSVCHIKPAPEFARQLANQACQAPSLGTAQDLAILTFALAKLNILDLELMSRLAGEIQLKVGEMNNLGLVNILWAFGKVQFKHDEMCQSVIKLILHRGVDSFPEQSLSSLLLGLANLQLIHHELLEAIANRLALRMDALGEQTALNAAWAFACLDVLHLPKVRQLFQQAPTSRVQWHATSKTSWQQLVQTRLAWDQTHHRVSSPFLDAFAGPTKTATTTTTNETMMTAATTSYMQTVIFHLLERELGAGECISETVLLQV